MRKQPDSCQDVDDQFFSVETDGGNITSVPKTGGLQPEKILIWVLHQGRFLQNIIICLIIYRVYVSLYRSSVQIF